MAVAGNRHLYAVFVLTVWSVNSGLFTSVSIIIAWDISSAYSNDKYLPDTTPHSHTIYISSVHITSVFSISYYVVTLSLSARRTLESDFDTLDVGGMYLCSVQLLSYLQLPDGKI